LIDASAAVYSKKKINTRVISAPRSLFVRYNNIAIASDRGIAEVMNLPPFSAHRTFRGSNAITRRAIITSIAPIKAGGNAQMRGARQARLRLAGVLDGNRKIIWSEKKLSARGKKGGCLQST
jgi:hypothetical protein